MAGGIRVAVTFQGAEAEAVRALQSAAGLESAEAVIVLGLWHVARHYGLDLPGEVFDLAASRPAEELPRADVKPEQLAKQPYCSRCGCQPPMRVVTNQEHGRLEL